MDRLISDERDAQLASKFVLNHKRPFILKIVDGRIRSYEQNRLWQMWCREVAEQLGDRTQEDVRCYCKLNFGVPIRCRDDEKYRSDFHADVAGMSYERQIHLMRRYAVTRWPEMTTAQFKEMLDAIYPHFTEWGIKLTHPDDQGLAA